MTYLKGSELLLILNRSIFFAFELELDSAKIGDISLDFMFSFELVNAFFRMSNFDLSFDVSEVSELCLVLHGVELPLVETVLHEVLVPLEHIFERSEFSHLFYFPEFDLAEVMQ